MISRIRGSLRDERGENSIMQMVVVAIIAITVTMGLVAFPGLVRNSQAQSVRATIDALSKVEDSVYTRTGRYIFTDGLGALIKGENGVKITAQSGVSLIVAPQSRGGGYAIYAKSQSGEIVYRSSLCNGSFFGTKVFGQLRGGATAQKDINGRTFAQCFPGIGTTPPPASAWYNVK